jgi:hypothetical protein
MSKRRDFTAEPAPAELRLTGHSPIVRLEMALEYAQQWLENLAQEWPSSDRKGKRRIEDLARQLKEVKAPGRPRKDPGNSKREMVRRFFDEHGREATVAHFPNLKESTLEKYVGGKRRWNGNS